MTIGRAPVWRRGGGRGYPAGMTNADAPVSRFFDSQGLKLHYADWGNEAAAPLLLIHGTRDHARSWDWVARALRDRFHVMALDLRGHGDSAWSPDGAYLAAYHLVDILELVESLGGGPVSIIGHSFGGNVAARYAGTYPEKIAKIVFVDSLGPDPKVYAQWDAEGPVGRTRAWLEQRRDPRLLQSRRLASIEQAAERMRRNNQRLSEEQAYHLAKHGVNHSADGYGWKFDPRVSMFAPDDFAVRGSHFYTEITAPALILTGQGWATDAAKDGRAALFRDARAITFEHAGHWIHHDAFEDFMAAVTAFL